jgi:hypothetical protein
MAEEDKSRVVINGEGNGAVYGKDGSLAQVIVDGKVRNVGMSESDRRRAGRQS